MRELPNVHVIDLSDPDAPPGFRTRDLTNDQASDAMLKAVAAIEYAASDARLQLLRLGFADSHSLCREIDATTSQYAEAFIAIRHQREGTAP